MAGAVECSPARQPAVVHVLRPAVNNRTARAGAGVDHVHTTVQDRADADAAGLLRKRATGHRRAARGPTGVDIERSAALDDQSCGRAVHALLAAAVDRGCARHPTAQHHLMAGAVEYRTARQPAAVHVLRPAVDNRAACAGAGVDYVETTAVQDRADANAPLLLGHDTPVQDRAS